jgi:hypothetical protein
VRPTAEEVDPSALNNKEKKNLVITWKYQNPKGFYDSTVIHFIKKGEHIDFFWRK